MTRQANFLSRPAMPLNANHTCSASYVRLIVQLLDQLGHDGPGLARKAGIDARALLAPDGWIPNAQSTALWREARDATGDEGFGLAVAAQLGPESFSLLGHSMMLGRNLGEAYRRAARDLHLLGDLFEIRVEEDKDNTALVLAMQPGKLATLECIDAALAAILVSGRRLCADPGLIPLAVEMSRPPPLHPLAFESLLGCRPRFGMRHNRLLFRQSDMDRPVYSGHPALAEIFDRQIAHLKDDSLANRLRRRLVTSLPLGVPNLDDLAAELGMSPRTLHRRLTEAGLNYRQLLDDTRRELARDYLAHGGFSKQRISELLGFAEPASFSRARRRWEMEAAGTARWNAVDGKNTSPSTRT